MPNAARPPAVLLVEDDATNRLIARSMLRHLGVEPDVAEDGSVGVRMAAERAYDVVLMDIQMPVMDGVEAMRAIRALLPPGRCPRIVAVTAHAVVGTRERMLAAGFDDFYNKPLSIALLQEAIAVDRPAPAAPALIAGRDTSRDAASAASLLASVRAHVRSLLGEDDEAFVEELVESFASSSREAVESASQARTVGDGPAVAAAAHKLKGSASNIGLESLASVWDGVETSIRSGSMPAQAIERALVETRQAVALLEAA